MTGFTVVWPEGAQDDLTELWIRARDRNSVTAAAQLIDIEVDEDDCVVEIVRVKFL